MNLPGLSGSSPVLAVAQSTFLQDSTSEDYLTYCCSCGTLIAVHGWTAVAGLPLADVGMRFDG